VATGEEEEEEEEEERGGGGALFAIRALTCVSTSRCLPARILSWSSTNGPTSRRSRPRWREQARPTLSRATSQSTNSTTRLHHLACDRLGAVGKAGEWAQGNASWQVFVPESAVANAGRGYPSLSHVATTRQWRGNVASAGRGRVAYPRWLATLSVS
jgi:hypothetical protein